MVDEVGKQLSREFRDVSKQILDSSGNKCEEDADRFQQFHHIQEKQILDIQLNLVKFAWTVNSLTPATPSIQP